jgi:hypothetical protein
VAGGRGRHAEDAIDRVFPLDDIAGGVEPMRASRHFGQIVIAM